MSDAELAKYMATLKPDDPMLTISTHVSKQRQARRITEAGGMRAAKFKVLQAIAASTAPLDFNEYSHQFSFVAVRELHDAELISGAPCYLVVAAESQFLAAELTHRGRDYLDTLQQSVEQQAAEPAKKHADQHKDWFDKPLGKVAIGVVTALIGGAALWAISHWSAVLF